MRQTFNQYDTNGDGVLDEMEVAAMMVDIGFHVDGSYLQVPLKFSECTAVGDRMVAPRARQALGKSTGTMADQWPRPPRLQHMWRVVTTHPWSPGRDGDVWQVRRGRSGPSQGGSA